jgi:hypothetical protein
MRKMDSGKWISLYIFLPQNMQMVVTNTSTVSTSEMRDARMQLLFSVISVEMHMPSSIMS